MKIYASYQSPLGYTSGGDKNIDSYGVDHSNFTTRDEVEYQSFRQEEENRRIKGYQKYGLTEGYPQFGTNFWGNPTNNYGFGSSNIHENIENLRDERTGFASPFGRGSWGTSQNDLGSGFASYNTGNGTMSYAPDGYFTNPINLNRNVSNPLFGFEEEEEEEEISPRNNTIDYSRYGKGYSRKFIDTMLQDKIFQRALNEYIIPNEGGYVNDPDDPGKETNMGISKRYHPDEDIKNLTRERSNAKYYKEYWNWNGLNKLPPEIIGFVFDHGARTSPQHAIETTHQVLGISSPHANIIGEETLNKLKSMGYNEFLNKYKELVHKQDKGNKKYKKFGRGWSRRTNGYHLSY